MCRASITSMRQQPASEPERIRETNLRLMVKIDSGDLEKFYPTPWGASLWGTLRVWSGSDPTGGQPRKGAAQSPQTYVPLKFSSPILFLYFHDSDKGKEPT